MRLMQLKLLFLLCLTMQFSVALANTDAAGTDAVISPNPQNIRHNPYPVRPPYDAIYSHAVEVKGNGRYLHVSGQLGFTESGELPATFKGQTAAAIDNVQRVLASADMSLEDIVHMRFLITDREQVHDLVAVRTEKLAGLAPAVTTFVVHGLLKEEWLIEIEAVAYK